MFNPHTKYEVSINTSHKDMKGNAKCKNSRSLGDLGVTHRVHLWLDGTVDFLLAIIQLFSLALLSEICQNKRFLKGGSL